MRTLSEPDDDGRRPTAAPPGARPGGPSDGPSGGPSDGPSGGPSGDPEATLDATVAEFSAFYHDYAPRLVAFLRWQGVPLPDAADCAQEALTQAFRRWRTVNHPRAWCRTTASRLYAKRVGSPEQPSDELDRAGAPLLAPETEIEELEQRHTVLAVLGRLPGRQRQVMAWTYDGATPSEIAEELRIAPEAVRSTLYKARKALRTMTEEGW